MADETSEHPENSSSDDSSEQGGQSVLVKIVRAAFIILFFQVFWKLGGFLLSMMIAAFWGPDVKADAYFFITENVIYLLQTFSLKIAIPVLVPVFKEERERAGEERAWGFLNTIVNLVLIIQALIMVAGMVYASEFIALAGEGFNRQTEQIAAHLMRWTMPGVFVISFATVTYAILNSYKEFGYASAGDAVQKITWSLAFLALGVFWVKSGSEVPIQAMIISFLLGAAGNLLVHLFGLRGRLGLYRPSFPVLRLKRAGIEIGCLAVFAAIMVGVGIGLAHSEVPDAVLQAGCAAVAGVYLILLWWRAKQSSTALSKFAALCVPLLFGILFAKYRDLFTNYYLTFTGKGVFTDVKLARRVGELPNTLIAQAVGLAILPYLCDLAQKKHWDEFAKVMTRTLKVMFMVFVPLTVATVILSESLIDLLYNRGDWDHYHIRHAGRALGLYILALLFFAIENPIQQSFASMQRLWTPTLIGFCSNIFYLLVLYLGIKVIGIDLFLMVALIVPMARIFKGFLLIGAMRYHLPILPFREISVFLAKMAVVCTAVGAAMWWSHGLVTGKLEIDQHRSRSVMVDTFNVEARAWNAENVVELEIVSRPGEQQTHCLWVNYHFSPRRKAILLRRMDDFKLGAGQTIHFEIRASRPYPLAIQLIADEQTESMPEVFELKAGEFNQISYKVPQTPGEKTWTALHLWDASAGDKKTQIQAWLDNLRIGDETIDDFESSSKGWSALDGQTVQVVDIRQDQCERDLMKWGLKEDEARALAKAHPVRAREQLMLVDWLDRRQENAWVKESAADTLRKTVPQKNTEWPDGFKAKIVLIEYGLLHDRPGTVERSLKAVRLKGMDEFSFKARSEGEVKLRITLVDYSDARSKAEFEVKKTDKRKSYHKALSSFSSDQGFNLSEVVTMQIEKTGGKADGRLWLDNFSFKRPVNRIPFEMGKIIHCAVPTALGVTVYAFLLWLLRVQEAAAVVRWIREEGVAKVKGKLRRK